MKTVREVIDFVNAQIDFQERQAQKHKNDIVRQRTYRERAQQFGKLLEFIESAARSHEADDSASVDRVTPPPSPPSLTLTPDDIAGLPEELLGQLSLSESDRRDFQVIQAINALGGAASLDQIIIHHYRQMGEILERTKLNGRLYRMSQRGQVFSVPQKKGAYSTRPFETNDEQTELL